MKFLQWRLLSLFVSSWVLFFSCSLFCSIVYFPPSLLSLSLSPSCLLWHRMHIIRGGTRISYFFFLFSYLFSILSCMKQELSSLQGCFNCSCFPIFILDEETTFTDSIVESRRDLIIGNIPFPQSLIHSAPHPQLLPPSRTF